MSQKKDLIITLATLQSRLQKRIDQNLGLHGISFTEFLVMYHLNDAPNMTMQRIILAQSIGLSASGVTRLVNPMEKIGLVQKELNPRDARVSLVKLSKTGAQLFKNALVSFEQIADSILKPINEKQIVTLLNLAKALL